MLKTFFKKISNECYLKELREVQELIKEKEILVNKLRCPTYHGNWLYNVEDFSRYFADIMKGIISPEEFAARCACNRKIDRETLFNYLNKLGEYLVLFADYENKATSILSEIKELKIKEQELKKKLKIY